MACIAGIISQHANLDIDSTGQLRKMLRLMRRRGPDNSVVRTLYNHCGAVGAYEINLAPAGPIAPPWMKRLIFFLTVNCSMIVPKG
jgi:asparagine synthetase B (glutamine-hydrolysing)